MKLKCPYCNEETKLDSVMYNVGLVFYAFQKCKNCKKSFEIVNKKFKTKKVKMK